MSRVSLLLVAFVLSSALPATAQVQGGATPGVPVRPPQRPLPPRDQAAVHATDVRRPYRQLLASGIELVAGRVEQLDPDGLMRALEHEPRHACGGGPMVAVLDAARRLGATTSRLLQYADSGDVSGDKSSVVGYMAAAIW